MSKAIQRYRALALRPKPEIEVWESPWPDRTEAAKRWLVARRDTAPPPVVYRERRQKPPEPAPVSAPRREMSARWRCFWLGVGAVGVVSVPVLGILLDFNWGVLTVFALTTWLKALD